MVIVDRNGKQSRSVNWKNFKLDFFLSNYLLELKDALYW